MHIADMIFTRCDSLSGFNSQSENAEVWHNRDAYVSVALLYKPVRRDLVPSLHKMKLADEKSCDVGIKEK